MDKISTIRVKNRTKEKLESFGKFGESHDELLDRILNDLKKRHKNGKIR